MLKKIKIPLAKNENLRHGLGLASSNHWAVNCDWIKALPLTKYNKALKTRLEKSIVAHVLGRLNGSIECSDSEFQKIINGLELDKRVAFNRIEKLESRQHPSNPDINFVKVGGSYFDALYFSIALLETGLEILPPPNTDKFLPLVVLKQGEIIALIMPLNKENLEKSLKEAGI